MFIHIEGSGRQQVRWCICLSCCRVARGAYVLVRLRSQSWKIEGRLAKSLLVRMQLLLAWFAMSLSHRKWWSGFPFPWGCFPRKPGHDATSGTLSFHLCVKVHLWGGGTRFSIAWQCGVLCIVRGKPKLLFEKWESLMCLSESTSSRCATNWLRSCSLASLQRVKGMFVVSSLPRSNEKGRSGKERCTCVGAWFEIVNVGEHCKGMKWEFVLFCCSWLDPCQTILRNGMLPSLLMWQRCAKDIRVVKWNDDEDGKENSFHCVDSWDEAHHLLCNAAVGCDDPLLLVWMTPNCHCKAMVETREEQEFDWKKGKNLTLEPNHVCNVAQEGGDWSPAIFLLSRLWQHCCCHRCGWGNDIPMTMKIVKWKDVEMKNLCSCVNLRDHILDDKLLW